MAHIQPNDPFIAGEKANCSFCDQPADAYWHLGEFNFCVCCGCATERLPLLIADAVTAKRPNVKLDTTLEAVANSFYRGAAMAYQRLNERALRSRFCKCSSLPEYDYDP